MQTEANRAGLRIDDRQTRTSDQTLRDMTQTHRQRGKGYERDRQPETHSNQLNSTRLDSFAGLLIENSLRIANDNWARENEICSFHFHNICVCILGKYVFSVRAQTHTHTNTHIY